MCADADEQQQRYILRPRWRCLVWELLMWNSGLCKLAIPAHRLGKEKGRKEGKRFMNAVMCPGFCCHFK